MMIISFGRCDSLNLSFAEQIKFSDFSKVEDFYQSKDGRVLLLRSESLSEKEAEQLIKNKLIQLKLLFSSQKAAYPGMLTKNTSCSDVAIFPTEIKVTASAKSWAAQMPATADHFYGSCGSREEIFWSQYQVLYCKKFRTLYDLKYFVPIKSHSRASGFDFEIARCSDK